MQQPTIGRIVLVPADPSSNNGADEAPAVITRVWSPTMLNVRVIGDDSGAVDWRTSVQLFPSREALQTAQAELPPDMRSAVPHAAYWPDRI